MIPQPNKPEMSEQNKPDEEKSIDQLVRKILRQCAKDKMPFGMMITHPDGYASGLSPKFASEENMTESNYEHIVACMYYGLLDILIKYAPPEKLKAWVDKFHNEYILTNYDKFVDTEFNPINDTPEDDDDNDYQPK